jgi:peptidoglycan hydrolase-like protein with peptidoglycan-binding domain
MALAIGSIGPQVRELQGFLNLLPTALPRLAPDAQFGPKTRGRVQEFQRTNNLVPDGIAGPLTMDAIVEFLKRLGVLPLPPFLQGAVRPINQQILGMAGVDNLIQQIFPPIMVVSTASFRPGDQRNLPNFSTSAGRTGRLGIFAAQKGGVERAVILVLPATGTPDRVNICITQRFSQATKTLDPLGWNNPLSQPFVLFALLKHVINRWGAQTLASKKEMAFLYILRAKGTNELGPFAKDGAFVRQVLTELASLTNNAFSFGHIEAFTFSNGINEFNIFSQSLTGHLTVEAVYNIDPNPAITAAAPKGAVRKQFVSGQTFRGATPPGFEFMPEARWANEPAFFRRSTFDPPPIFNYLHNHCMPLYALHLGIQLS